MEPNIIVGLTVGIAAGFLFALIAAFLRLEEPIKDALTAYAKHTAVKAQLEAQKVAITVETLAFEKEKLQLELEKLRGPKLLEGLEREAVIAKVVSEAYLLTEAAAKQNRVNKVVVSSGWKLDEATRVAKEMLSTHAIEVSSRDLVLKLEAQVAAHDPRIKNKPVAPALSSAVEKR